MNNNNNSQYAVHYSHPLVTWGPTLLGATAAVVTAVMLNALGASLGFAAASQLDSTTSADTASTAATSAGIIGLCWMIVSNLLAVAFGAWLAARATANPDHHRGTLQGIAVWAVTSLVVVYMAGSALSGTASTLLQSAGAASSVSVARNVDNGNLNSNNVQNTAENAANEAQATYNRNAPEIRDAAAKTAGVTSAAAFGTFLSMLLGMFAAIIGARIGARHPQWDNRPHYNSHNSTTTDSNSTTFRPRNAA